MSFIVFYNLWYIFEITMGELHRDDHDTNSFDLNTHTQNH